MENSESNRFRGLVGQAWLHRFFALKSFEPFVTSEWIQGARKSLHYQDRVSELYPKQYAPSDTVRGHLKFAFRYEAWDPNLMAGVMKAVDPAELEAWMREDASGIYSRRAWFFFEFFTGKRLDLPDVTRGNYVDALDAELHLVGEATKSKRHRVNNNLLGVAGMCPFVRRTDALEKLMREGLREEAQKLLVEYDEATLARAVSYLYTKETKSSFAIEGETPNATRTERFVRALQAAPGFEASESSLVELQNAIVDPRYAAKGWRTNQNFIGENRYDGRGKVHFICPKPEDVPSLMDAWVRMTRNFAKCGVEPLVAAGLAAFSFVLIHPFEDGNGRIHRFLIHHLLSSGGFSPKGMIFPVSASILRDSAGYDRVLESFSRPLMELTEWDWADGDEIVVANETADYFRYFDATRFVEYLYERVADTIRVDLQEELKYLAKFDRAWRAVREIVDMPDKKLALFVRLSLQNEGKISAKKRELFAEISDAEMARLEAEVMEAMAPASSPLSS
jgi:Fic family protein